MMYVKTTQIGENLSDINAVTVGEFSKYWYYMDSLINLVCLKFFVSIILQGSINFLIQLSLKFVL